MLAYGEMNLSPSQLAEYTPRDFDIKCRGFSRAGLKRLHMFRTLAWITIMPHIDTKKGATIDKIWPLTVEKESKGTLFSQEEIDVWAEIYKNRKEGK